MEESQKFGGASQLITMSLGDLASSLGETQNRMEIMQELRDYIKLEILLMQKFEEESKSKQDSKLSFRIKDEISNECLNMIKKKTGWTTSKSVRISLLWYLYANSDDFVANDSYVPLLNCPHCGFKTHDQRALGVHVQELHESVCQYCGTRYPINEGHSCPEMERAAIAAASQTRIDQFTSVPITDTDLEETKLLQELGLEELETLGSTEEEIPEIDRSELKEIIEERLKERKAKKEKDDKIDQLQSEISEILESLREDGLIE
ncbi:MAG: hypothetical protein ACFFDS_06905 [Candidatus Thorarchaeota archaeon]